MQNLIIALGVTVLGIFIYYALDLVPRVKRDLRRLEQENKMLNDFLQQERAESLLWRTRYVDAVTPGQLGFKDQDNDRPQ